MSIEHTYSVKDGTETRVLTKAKAIRLKCLDCSGYQPGEVTKCTVHLCPLYPFRFGNEKGLERIYVDQHGADNDVDEEEEWEDIVGEDDE